MAAMVRTLPWSRRYEVMSAKVKRPRLRSRSVINSSSTGQPAKKAMR